MDAPGVLAVRLVPGLPTVLHNVLFQHIAQLDGVEASDGDRPGLGAGPRESAAVRARAAHGGGHAAPTGEERVICQMCRRPLPMGEAIRVELSGPYLFAVQYLCHGCGARVAQAVAGMAEERQPVSAG